jgi:hypothetical protein
MLTVENSSNIYQNPCLYVTSKENNTIRTLDLTSIFSVFCKSESNIHLLKIINVYGSFTNKYIYFINISNVPFFLLCDSTSNIYNFKNPEEIYCKVEILAFALWNFNKKKLEILSY